ncbi:MAG: hypothetical protein QW117_02540 [Candidatus Pacearchaeota archaeon]
MVNVDIKINMINAVNEVLKYRKENPKIDFVIDYEKIIKYVSEKSNSVNDYKTRMAMIAAASKAINILQKEPNLKDKEVINKVMKEFPSILEKIE